MGTLVVGPTSKAERVRVEVFSKMRAMLRPSFVMLFAVPLGVTQLGGEVDEGEKLVLGEVDLLQKAPSVKGLHSPFSM
jgi:hypothetical protein